MGQGDRAQAAVSDALPGPASAPVSVAASTPVPLDLVAARRWALTARSNLAEARERINALNVFPVPDGDTGTNLFLTLDGAIDVLRGHLQVRGPDVTLREGLGLLARGTLLSARGNSGVILSQLSRGLWQAVEDRAPEATEEDIEQVDADTLAEAFALADSLAWAGVTAPVEGTILSVSRAAAAGARQAASQPDARAYDVAAAAVRAATGALNRTPEQLEVLARAGVVDAGGAGYVVLVEALEKVLSGRVPEAADPPVAAWLEAAAPPDERALQLVRDSAHAQGCPAGDGAFEVMYLVRDADAERADQLRTHLQRVGSSVLVVGGPEEWRVHVHLDQPEHAVEAGSLAGHVDQVAVTALESDPAADHDQTERSAAHAGVEPGEHSATGVVSCLPSAALAALAVQAGARAVRSEPGARASTGELLAAVRAVAADTVVVLPNDPDTVLAARAAAAVAEDDGVHVEVLETVTVLEGLSATAVWTAAEDAAANLAAMRAAVAGTTSAAVTIAGKVAATAAGPCRPGQVLGVIGQEVAVIADDIGPVADRLVEVMVDHDTEILTVIAGSEAVDGELDATMDQVSRDYPGVEIVRIDGGQSRYRWLLGVE